MKTPVRILLVDDHAIVREGYRALLGRQPDFTVIGEAGDAEAAYRCAIADPPDVVVLDLSMPGASGLTVLSRLRQRLPACRLLVFSMHVHPSFATQAFDAGAHGYVSKASPADELVQAVRTVAGGGRYLSADLAEALAWERLGHEQGMLTRLSPREFEVLRMLVAGQPVATIAATLHLSPKTVMNLHYAIKRKLEVETDIELIRLATRLGVVE